MRMLLGFKSLVYKCRPFPTMVGNIVRMQVFKCGKDLTHALFQDCLLLDSDSPVLAADWRNVFQALSTILHHQVNLFSAFKQVFILDDVWMVELSHERVFLAQQIETVLDFALEGASVKDLECTGAVGADACGASNLAPGA